MKVLITGANSYIGMSFENYIIENFSEDYKVDTLDMQDPNWINYDFSNYDSIFHVAGIAHQKETNENKEMYYKVNRDLAIKVAKKAKSDGVKQFIFLSTMSVYGKETGIIEYNTLPNPKSNYGKSKYEAERKIEPLDDNDFKVCIVRPPMVYGDGCKGNYQLIVKIVKRFPIFPRIKNKRSLIHIDNLVKFVKTLVDDKINGLFLPQNKEYVSTMDLAKDISVKINKKIYFSYLLGFIVFILRPFNKKLKKAFGNLTYKKEL